MAQEGCSTGSAFIQHTVLICTVSKSCVDKAEDKLPSSCRMQLEHDEHEDFNKEMTGILEMNRYDITIYQICCIGNEI